MTYLDARVGVERRLHVGRHGIAGANDDAGFAQRLRDGGPARGRRHLTTVVDDRERHGAPHFDRDLLRDLLVARGRTGREQMRRIDRRVHRNQHAVLEHAVASFERDVRLGKHLVDRECVGAEDIAGAVDVQRDVARAVDAKDRATVAVERRHAVAGPQIDARAAEHCAIARHVRLNDEVTAVGLHLHLARLQQPVAEEADRQDRRQHGEVPPAAVIEQEAVPRCIAQKSDEGVVATRSGRQRQAASSATPEPRGPGTRCDRASARFRVMGAARYGQPCSGRSALSPHAAISRAAHPGPALGGENMAVHPPSIRPFGLTALASSGPVALRHPKLTTYRCFLPDLTGFMALRRVGPGPQRCSAQPVPRYTNLGQEFSPAIAACGYRAPLAPRLARPQRSYHATHPRQEAPSAATQRALRRSLLN